VTLEGRKSIMWTTDELDRVGNAEELQLASRRPDGTLRGFVTIWVVRDGDDIYVRSAHGPDNPWYVRALASGEGRIRAGGVERDVKFDHLDEGDAMIAAIDADYRSKYGGYDEASFAPVVAEQTHRLTLRLVPKE
jgi:hypothetical protein